EQQVQAGQGVADHEDHERDLPGDGLGAGEQPDRPVVRGDHAEDVTDDHAGHLDQGDGGRAHGGRVDVAVGGAEQVGAAAERVGGQDHGALAAEDEQREVVRDDVPDRD